VGLTTITWLIAAFLTPPTDEATLIAFYKKVRPAGPGWSSIRRAAGMTGAPTDNIRMATLGWVSGCAVIWSSLFAIGNFLYGRTGLAVVLTAIFVVSGLALIHVVRTLWDRPAAGAD
jgi:hypothetical protein